MPRSLDEIANATPKDYLSFVPQDPLRLAMKMVAKARQVRPILNEDDGEARLQNHQFLYIGPGSGLVIQPLLMQSKPQEAWGVETSRRGIAASEPLVRNYILWMVPWELNFRSNYIDVALISKFMQTILTPEEFALMRKEVDRVSRYSALFDPLQGAPQSTERN